MKRAVVTVTAQAGTSAAAEYVVATLPAVPLPAEPGGVLLSQVVIDGFINYTPGTSATVVTIRVRRGTLVGTLVGVGQASTAVAGAAMAIPISAADPINVASPPAVPGQVYVVTAQQTGGAAVGTCNYAVVTATTS